MKLSTTYNFQSETDPLDADKYSTRLQEYHRLLWSKPLPNGKNFELEKISMCRLHHKSDLGEFTLSSDRAIPTFSKWQKLKHITSEIPPQTIEDFNNTTETIGAITVWPGKQVDRKPTINVMKGFINAISDRLDLTIECVRRHYLGKTSPLTDTLNRYDDFFALFTDFKGYIEFFHFQDYVSPDYRSVNVAQPFANFETAGTPRTVEEYIQYMDHTKGLVEARNERISALDLRE